MCNCRGVLYKVVPSVESEKSINTISCQFSSVVDSRSLSFVIQGYALEIMYFRLLTTNKPKMKGIRNLIVVAL